MLYYLLDSLYFVHLCLGIFLISCAVCLSFSIFAAMCCLFGVINEINKWNYQKQINLQNFAENTSHQCWQLRWRDIVKYSWKRWKQTLRGRFEAVNPSITALICACEWLAYIRANKIKKLSNTEILCNKFTSSKCTIIILVIHKYENDDKTSCAACSAAATICPRSPQVVSWTAT